MHEADHPPERLDAFSPVPGGPLYGLLCRRGLVPEGGFSALKPALLAWASSWGVMAVLSAIDATRSLRFDPILADYAVLARLWVAIPLFFAAESQLHQRVLRTTQRLARSGFVPCDDAARAERVRCHAERLRDMRRVELGLIVLVVAFGVTSSSAPSVMPALFRDVTVLDATRARIWYMSFALPLFQFLMLRWLWRWAIWSWVLIALSRLPLSLMPTHPDRAGGIGFLNTPTIAFALFSAGVSAAAAGTWATQVVVGTDVRAFGPPLVVLVAVMLLLAFAPLFAFIRLLLHARLDGIRDYGHVALVHNRLFHRRWVARDDDSVLGTPDISSLADLQTAYTCMAEMRLMPVNQRAIAAVCASVLLPMIPLLALAVPLREVVLELARSLFVGLPN